MIQLAKKSSKLKTEGMRHIEEDILVFLES